MIPQRQLEKVAGLVVSALEAGLLHVGKSTDVSPQYGRSHSQGYSVDEVNGSQTTRATLSNSNSELSRDISCWNSLPAKNTRSFYGSFLAISTQRAGLAAVAWRRRAGRRFLPELSCPSASCVAVQQRLFD